MYEFEDITVAARRYDIAESEWLDLSTTINQIGYPVEDLPIEIFHCYPSLGAKQELELLARSAYNVPQGSGLISAAGSQIISQMLPKLKANRRVAIVAPDCSLHGGAWRAEGHDVEEVGSLDHASRADVAIVVNPSDPDGQLHSNSGLKQLAETLEQRGGLLIIDESYMDVMPKKSFIKHSERQNVVVLRSLGKFFGLSGLRLGFAIGAGRHLGVLRDMLGPWVVSGPAIHIGCKALNDKKWHKQALKELGQRSARLGFILKSRHIETMSTNPLFRTVKVMDAGALHHQLACRAIWTRQFDERPNWLRIGVPKSEAGMKRFEASLDEIIAMMPVAA